MGRGELLPGSDRVLYYPLMMADVYGTIISPLDTRCPMTVPQHRIYLAWADQLGFDGCNSLTPVSKEILRATMDTNILPAGAG
jgi:hypothetical protein